jgi:hypothetical protein
MAVDVEVDSGTYTPESMKLRRRLAQAMLQEGIQTSPIQSPWQGVARLANAMMGGMGLRRLEEREDASAKELRDFTAGTYGVGSGSVGSDSKGPAPPPVASSDKIAFGRKVYDFFKAQGLNDAQAAAIAGNMAWEGGGRADLVNPGDNWRNSPYSPHSAGIAQWNDRLPNLIKYAKAQGIEIPEGRLTDAAYVRKAIAAIPLETQLGFAWQEMQGPEGRALAMIKAGEDLPTAARGAISYHRPAGWTWNNPAGGHGFQGRMSLAEQIMRAAQQPAPAQVAQAPTGTLTDATGMSVPAPLAAGAVSPPMAAPPTGAPGGPGAPPAAPPVAAGLPTPPAPAASVPGPAAGLSQEQIRAQAWASLGPRAALVQAALRSNNPKIAAAAETEIRAAIARIQAAQPPVDPIKAAQLEKTKVDTEEARAKLPKMPEEVGKQFTGGLEQLKRFPTEFGKEAFERSIGPWQATDGDSGTPGSMVGAAMNYIPQQIARGVAELKAAVGGGAAPTEVRDRIETATLNLAAVMKPLIRKPGEGAWSDKDQANLEKQIGQLTRSRSVEEYNRRLNDIQENVSKIFQVPTAAPRDLPRSANAPEPGKSVSEVIDSVLPPDPITGRTFQQAFGGAPKPPPQLPQIETPTELSMRERLLRAILGGQ